MAETKPAGSKAAEKAPERSEPASAAESFPELSHYLDVPIRLSIELGRRSVRVRELLELRPGALFDLEKLTGEPIDLVAGDYAFARGEIVVSGETLVARVSEILKTGEELS